jgi:MFS family permease
VRAASATEPRTARRPPISRVSGYAWLVFGLTFVLLLSDYMSRQLLAAVFPLLKADWRLSDSQLGALGGVVPLAVGILTLPLSFVADRLGRVRSIAVMAIAWSLATVGCGLSRLYGEMMLARLVMGVGEAAYGSVGLALVVSIFPPTMRAAIAGAFTAGGVFGSVLGLAFGGVIAANFGWRWAFAIVGLIGLLLGAAYPFIVRETPAEPTVGAEPARHAVASTPVIRLRQLWRTLFPSATVVWTYVGSGAQLFIAAALLAWTPSFLNRYHAMATGKAALVSAVFVLGGGAGMIGFGALADRVSRGAPRLQLVVAAVYCLATTAFLALALLLPANKAQLALLGAAMTLASSSLGPAGAVVAAGVPAGRLAVAFATLTLANNAVGLAPGPFVIGALADRWGLLHALQLAPIAGVVAAGAFGLALRYETRRGARGTGTRP